MSLKEIKPGSRLSRSKVCGNDVFIARMGRGSISSSIRKPAWVNSLVIVGSSSLSVVPGVHA
ncbi:hypothetical protein, partial [Serinicoccus chungangensis]|uniref:hypothetical protein n=1 Tax=Serinicoccus chungangensis TaxID=767452 RepID=UPI001F3CC520